MQSMHIPIFVLFFIMISQATKTFIKEHLNDDLSKIALSQKKYPDIDVLVAVHQIKSRKKTEHKIPSWYKNFDILFPLTLSIEQSSSEHTALYKSDLLKGDTFIDLTGGFGVDTAFIAPKFNKVFYVEKDKKLTELAAYNFNQLHLNHIHVVNQDSTKFLETIENVSTIYIDPARRDNKGNKTVSFSDCEPDVVRLMPILLTKSSEVLIKASPMLDISLALKELKNVEQVHVLSVDNECKELLFLIKNEHLFETKIICSNIKKSTEIQSLSFTIEEEKNSQVSYSPIVLQYLYEPNSSILKAGAYKILCEKFDVKKLHPNSHLYTSNVYVDDFPGRIFVVEKAFSLNKQALKENLQDLKKANITVRNFPLSVDELRKKLKLSEGGDCFLFATTLLGDNKVLIKCRK